jgi:hypothetical protein
MAALDSRVERGLGSSGAAIEREGMYALEAGTSYG